MAVSLMFKNGKMAKFSHQWGGVLLTLIFLHFPGTSFFEKNEFQIFSEESQILHRLDHNYWGPESDS
jgi:hypothetical protein